MEVPVDHIKFEGDQESAEKHGLSKYTVWTEQRTHFLENMSILPADRNTVGVKE